MEAISAKGKEDSATITLSKTPTDPILLDVRNLVQEFDGVDTNGRRSGTIHAVSDVSFQIRRGETLGVVGETGSGKSTMARSVLQIPPPKSGQVIFQGTDLTKVRQRKMPEYWRQIQMIFQDPYGSLDPKWIVEDIVEEPLVARRIGTKRERREKVADALKLVGLSAATYGERRPRELSGGQCQRVAIARALVLAPSLLICDEAVSSLDVLVQAQVLNLFEQLREELDLSYLFVAHDLAVVKQVSDRVAVMYLGRLCEVGPSDDIYNAPLHPYTAALIAAIPPPVWSPGRKRVRATIQGEVPSALDPPSGCRFRTRCPRAQDRCAEEAPILTAVRPQHEVACHFPLNT